MAIWEGCNYIDGHKEFGSGTHLKKEREDTHQGGGGRSAKGNEENEIIRGPMER